MVKIQVDLDEETSKMLELIKVNEGYPDKREAIKRIIHKYSFGWIPSPGDKIWEQTLLESVIDKISNHPYWRQFRSKNNKGGIIKEIQDVFDLDVIQLKKVIERLEKEGTI